MLLVILQYKARVMGDGFNTRSTVMIDKLRKWRRIVLQGRGEQPEWVKSFKFFMSSTLEMEQIGSNIIMDYLSVAAKICQLQSSMNYSHSRLGLSK